MGKVASFISGVAIGVVATRIFYVHKDEIMSTLEEKLGIESLTDVSNDVTNEYVKDIRDDECTKEVYHAIAKTYSGGDSDRDWSETDQLSVSDEQNVQGQEAGDSYEDKKSSYEESDDEDNKEKSKSLHLVDEREILGCKTFDNGIATCVLIFDRTTNLFYNSKTNKPIPTDLVIDYIGESEYVTILKAETSGTKCFSNEAENIMFVIMY